MNKILTIVVPTYNAEQYLRDNLESFCIEGILNDIEVLIINDGSSDSSVEIAEEYVARYPGTFRVISKKNGGHGSGINCGIKYASGIYFKVVDADDWVERDAFVQLINELKNGQSDLVYSGFYWVYDDGKSAKEQFEKKAETAVPFDGVVYQKQSSFDDIADKLYIKMHNMTIRTEILRKHQISIDEHCFYVDTEYITYPIPYVETVSFVNAFVYMYRIGRQGQSVGIDRMQKNEDNYDRVIASLLHFYSELGNEISCTPEKKMYIAGIIARVIAGKIKIMLSFPVSAKKKQELKNFDQGIRRSHPEVYRSNINRAVTILRKTGYAAYYPASILVRRYYH